MGPNPFWRNTSLWLFGGLALLGTGAYVVANWPSDIGVPSKAAAPTAQSVDSVPGGRQTPEYARLQQMADQHRADQARRAQGSAVPSPPEMEGIAARPNAAPNPEKPPPLPNAAPPAAAAVPPASGDTAPPQTGEMIGAMKEQAQNVLKHRERFEPAPSRMVMFEDIKGQRERAAAQKRAEALLAESRSPRPRDRRGLLLPGDILFAVLQTAINSDEPGPVRAKIVGERFKDAILLGGLSAFAPVVGSRPERVLVKFNYLTTPDRVTHAISAYAIDTETARTALASGVDHHYLERWGSLVAASFLEGYGAAIQNNNRVTSVGVFGNVVSVPKNDLNHGEIAREALGTVGQRLGGVVAQNFQRPNTITVNPGAGLGILIMSSAASGSDDLPPSAPPPPSGLARAARAEAPAMPDPNEGRQDRPFAGIRTIPAPGGDPARYDDENRQETRIDSMRD